MKTTTTSDVIGRIGTTSTTTKRRATENPPVDPWEQARSMVAKLNRHIFETGRRSLSAAMLPAKRGKDYNEALLRFRKSSAAAHIAICDMEEAITQQVAAARKFYRLPNPNRRTSKGGGHQKKNGR